jgi:hypothetical protein
MDAVAAYSVLMPLAPWEPEHQVRAALASLADQSHACSQLVLSCDGAPPPVLQAVLSGSPLPLEVIVGPGGEGVGPVLSRGLLACRHDLVMRADADDLSLPERAAIQVRAMVARPQLAALSAPILEFIADLDAPCGVRSVPHGAAALWRHSRWRNPLNHPAVMLRRQAVLAVGGYGDRPGFEDYDLWLRLLQAGDQLDNLESPLVMARVGVDHLARRRGYAYAVKEWRFLQACGLQGTLSWPRVLLLACLRCPVRVMPSALLSKLTRTLLRHSPPTSAPGYSPSPPVHGQLE